MMPKAKKDKQTGKMTKVKSATPKPAVTLGKGPIDRRTHAHKRKIQDSDATISAWARKLRGE